MILSFDVQLQVALRALEEVVAPALSDAEKHVVEQLHLAIATIGFVKTRLLEARRFARFELAHFATLAKAVAESADNDAGLLTQARHAQSVLDDPLADVADYEDATSRLRDEVTAVGSRCADAAKRAEVDAIVLNQSTALLAQYRQWTSPFGFELKPEELPAPAW